MKKHLLQSLLAVALLLVCGNVWGAEKTVNIDFSSQGYSNAQAIESVSIDDKVSITFDKGTNSNAPKYYATGTAIRCYGGNSFTVSTISGSSITKITLTFGSGGDSNAITSNVGTLKTSEWSGSSESVTFTISGASGHRRIQGISVTYSASTGGETHTVTIADNIQNGTVSADPAQAAENEEVTLTINPAEHYQLSTLTVTDANEKTIDVSDDYTFTMPACDVTVSATFTEKAKHTVTYMSLGAQVGEAENVYDGELCANMPDVTNISEDWTFAGWTTQSSYAMSTTAPAMFSATTPVTADVTLYAVFARTTEGGAASGWYKVTENPSDWSGEYLLVYEGDKSHNAVAWTGVDAASCGTGVTIADGVIAAKPDDAAILTIAPMTDGYSIKVNGGEKDGQYIYGASGSNAIKFGEESLNALSYDEDNKTVKIVSNTSVMRYNYASGDYRFRYYKSATFKDQQPVQLYKYTSGGTTFYTIYTITTPQTQDITISSVGWATACVPFTATVSGATAYTAKVEDGALVMTPITVIPAGAGVLLESVDGGATTATFTESGLEGEDVTDNQLRGNATNASVTWGNEEGATAIFTYYIFANDTEYGLGFYWQEGTGGSSVSCGAYKAALVVPGAPTTEPAAIGYRLDGTTMVEQLLQESSDAAIYDLQGRKVENATKGLYIVGGKKVMVK